MFKTTNRAILGPNEVSGGDGSRWRFAYDQEVKMSLYGWPSGNFTTSNAPWRRALALSLPLIAIRHLNWAEPKVHRSFFDWMPSRF